MLILESDFVFTVEGKPLLKLTDFLSLGSFLFLFELDEDILYC